MDNNNIDYENIRIALDLVGEQTIIDIIAKLNRMDAVASKRLINSLNYRVVEALDNLLLVLEAEEYINVIDKGRRPGKMPPLSAILQWVRYKGIPTQAAYPIAKNIGKFGVKPRPFLNEIIENNRRQGIDLFEEALRKDVEEAIKIIKVKIEE